ncbi:MAG: lamin tail domain-containing protein [Deltaproteobacteria bacterium]|nr:lamin tail domain-containing protein [Deltaproteobacteria bacterium]
MAACGPSDEEGGCKDTLVAGDLIITEVFADYAAASGGTGTDEGKEWFEIYNASDRPVDLEGVTITHGRPEGGTTAPKKHAMGPITIAPGTYLTLGNSTRDLLPAYVDYGYSNALGEFFNSNGGKLDLSCGSTVIDSAVYEAVKSGRSRQFTAAMPPDYTQNDNLANWCEASDTEFEASNFGTPGQDNDCRPSVAGQCADAQGSRPTVPPEAGQLVITEVMPSPGAVSDTVGEWFEAKALASFDLNGLALDRTTDTANPRVIESADCIHVNAGDYVVFARSADTAVNNLPANSVKGAFTFTLVAGSMATPGDVQILYNDQVIDAVTWTKTTTEKALQLDPDLTDATSNDSPSNFCDATTQYGAASTTTGRFDFGTPGAANTQCTLLPPAGMCDAAGTLRPIVKPAADQLQITEFLANPGNAAVGTDSTREWFEILNTGGGAFDLNGLTFASATGMTVVSSASCISIAGNAFGLVARSTDSANNGMLPAPDATFGFSLVDSNGRIEVRDGATVLETVIWTSVFTPTTANPIGVARQLDPDETASFATNGDAGTAASTQPWCPATTTYGDNTNRGTPKAANAQCP